MSIRDDYEEIGASIGRLVQEKQAAYGDSFNRACEILRVLYPEGVTPDKYRDFLAVTRVIDKLFRIATDRDALGESPWRDVMGYSLLSVAHPEEETTNNIVPPVPVEYVNVSVDLSQKLTTPVDDNGSPGISSEVAKRLEESGHLKPAGVTVEQQTIADMVPGNGLDS